MKILKVLIAIVFQFVLTATTAHGNEVADRAAVRNEAAQAYRSGDIESLERQHLLYSNFLQQRTASGAFKMNLFFDGIANSKQDSTEVELQADIARTLSWASSRKDSPLFHVLHAAALQSYADYFRGGGFASTVPPQAWKIYEDYIKRAGQYLIENEAIAGKSSTWHAWMLNIARTSPWPVAVVERLFDGGWQVNSNDYSLYVNTLAYFLPKWHGDSSQLDRFIRYAVTKAPPEFGPELYARLYSSVGESQYERRLYTDSLVEWSLMRAGLELWYARFSTPWNKNIVAYHACIAGDKVLAKQLFQDIGAQPVWEIWQPRARVTFDTCTRWAADPDAEPKSPRKSNEAEREHAQAPGA